MNKLESVQPYGLPPSTKAVTGSRLTQLRQEREQRRRRARWLSGMLLAMGLAFVAQGFVREQPLPREAALKPRPAVSKPQTVQSQPAQPQATLQPLKRG
jgi:hypothetical protein